jgi:ferredoxin
MVSTGSLQGSDAGMIPPGAVVLPVPCASLISPALLLRSFERGARSVAVLSCAGTCQQGHDRRRVRTAVSFTIKVLETFGMTAGRLMLVEGHAEESGDVAERLPKLEQSATVPPASEGLAQAQTSLGLQDLSLPAILSRLQAAHGLPTPQVITGADVPFGQVRVQGATPCTLCGVCAQLCPSQALALTQLPMSEALIFSHSRCVACGLCVEQCPEKIQHLDRALDLGGIAEPARVLAREDVIRCRRCQCPIAALSMLAKVHQALRSLPSGVLWDPGELCPSCRLAESVSVHAAMSGGRAEP